MTYTFPKSFVNLPKSPYQPTPITVTPGQIITIEKLFSKDVCNDLIKSFESNLKLETTPYVKRRGYAARVNDRTLLDDLPAAEILWKYLQNVLRQDVTFDKAIGLNPNLRIYRYREGQFFEKHYDESVSAMTKSGSGKTKWTLLIYLTGGDEFKGGGTIFHPHRRGMKPLNVHPDKGMALLHKHGDDCMLHEGELITGGVKWVLRSDVVF